MTEPIYLVYLDKYHLDDLLYVSSMAQMMGRLRHRCPLCLFVHGSGEQAERLLEAEGLFPDRKDGLIDVQSAREAALVERAVRQVNRRVVGRLTEEGVHAVGFQGMDRGLLRREAEGAMVAGKVDWLEALTLKRAVPVVSTLLHDPAHAYAREEPLSEAVCVLGQALQRDVVVVFFTQSNQPGVFSGEKALRRVPLGDVPAEVMPEPEAVRAVVETGLRTVLTSAGGLFGGAERLGTDVFLSKQPKID